MRVLDRIDLIEDIGSELQSRMTFADIDIFLNAFNVVTKGFQASTNSKRIYVKELLADKNEDLILKIANELEIDHNFSIAPKEASFCKAGYFKLFLSHLSSFKAQTPTYNQFSESMAFLLLLHTKISNQAKSGRLKLKRVFKPWMRLSQF